MTTGFFFFFFFFLLQLTTHCRQASPEKQQFFLQKYSKASSKTCTNRIEGAASTSTGKFTSSKPHKIFPWNESRDTELHDLEALARDGLRQADASIIAFAPEFAHLLNGILDPQRAMTDQAKCHSLFTMNDFVHVTAEQFARIAQRIALHRKLNVIRSLNVADQSKLMSSP